MSTLHERLLAEIGDLTRHLTGCVSCSTCEAAALGHAVRAVVELHSPIQLVLAGTPDQFIRCPLCPGGCDTATAIADALGVEIGDTPK